MVVEVDGRQVEAKKIDEMYEEWKKEGTSPEKLNTYAKEHGLTSEQLKAMFQKRILTKFRTKAT